jgi:hypothetical protein
VGTSLPVRTSTISKLADDIALAALLGGNLFGRFAMGPALDEISDKSERGRILNRAWRRYGTVNSGALAILVAGRLAARRGDAEPSRLHDGAVGAVVATGLASAASGVGFARQAPGGAVRMDSGHDVAQGTPQRAARIKRLVNALGALNLASEFVLAMVSSLE